MKTFTYPQICLSQFCGEISCEGCKHKPALDAYEAAYSEAKQQMPTLEHGRTIQIFDAYKILNR